MPLTSKCFVAYIVVNVTFSNIDEKSVTAEVLKLPTDNSFPPVYMPLNMPFILVTLLVSKLSILNIKSLIRDSLNI